MLNFALWVVDTGPVNSATLTLVPPRRLGALLVDARLAQARSLEAVAAASRFDEQELTAIEAGQLLLADAELDDLLAAYHVTPDQLLPVRSQVVLDLEQGEVVVAEETARLAGDAPTADEVLSAYLSLVYTLRRAQPGTPLVLRDYDVAVLARALKLAEPDVEARLTGLMANPTEEIGRLTRVLRHKLLVPVAGVVVAATAVGTVLVLRSDGGTSAPTTTEATTVTTRPGPVESSVPDAELIPPAQQQVNPDGSPGAVTQQSG